KPGGPLRACAVGLTLAGINFFLGGGPTNAGGQAFPLSAPPPVEAFVFFRDLLFAYFCFCFFCGVVLFFSFFKGELGVHRTAQQREARSTMLVFGSLLFVGLIAYLAVSGYQRTGDVNYFIDYGAFLVSFIVLIPVSTLILLRVLRWVDKFQNR